MCILEVSTFFSPIEPFLPILSVAHPKKGLGELYSPPLLGVENWKFCYIYTEFNIQITETRHFLDETAKFETKPRRNVFFRAWKYNFRKISLSLLSEFHIYSSPLLKNF